MQLRPIITPNWLPHSWTGDNWTFTCQRVIQEVLQHEVVLVYALVFGSNNFLYFLLDDDLGKPDSSYGSMDSFQVGPTFSSGWAS